MTTIIDLGVTTEAPKKTVKKMKRGESQKGRLICCSKCGYRFFLSEENEQWFKDQGFQAPRRCFNCRQEAKKMVENAM